jgi:D-alanyl-D-alanine carboxypeptidase
MLCKLSVLARLGFASLVFAVISLHAQLPPATQAAVDQVVEKNIKEKSLTSASIAIVQNGRLAYAHAYGIARVAGNVHARPNMRYKIGSNSKQIAAAALLLLTAEGKVSLDDPVARFFPELTRANDIHIRKLLSHSSGYEDYYPLDYVTPLMKEPTTVQAIMKTWARKPLNFDPGTRWQYSNTNYLIAGAIIEKVTGRPLIDFLRERIFSKLDMKSPIDVDRQRWSDTDPVGYTHFALGPARVAVPEGENWVFAAGELAMTASDLARWDISLMDGSILSPELLKELTTEMRLKDGVGTRYGLGLEIFAQRGNRAWAHTGGTSGFVSANTTYPDDRVSITVLTNEDSDAAIEIRRALEEVILSSGADSTAGRDLGLAKTVYAELASGTLDRSKLTSDANAYFTGEAIADFASSLKPLGSPNSFQQTSEGDRGGMKYRSFQVRTASRNLRVSCYFLPDGRLAQFLVN